MRPSSLMLFLGVLSLAGCSTEEPSTNPAPVDLLAPPAAGAGVQFKMVSTIDSGQEIERCQLFVAPKEGLTIHKDEVRFTAGSHHVLLYKTPYASLPTQNAKGVTMDGTQIHDCADGATAEWEVTGVIAGSQSSDGDTILGELPDGVAIKVEPGTVLLMNTHYLNASAEKVTADARVNLYTIPQDQVKTEAGILFLYNPFIRVPANGAAEARMRCPVSSDISLVRVQSHMHRRGVDFAASLTDDKGNPLQEIYTNKQWEQVPAKVYNPLLQVKAGQALDYRCDYKNTEARDVVQGRSTKDEMCMLIGPYFPRDPHLENCTDQNNTIAATWVGSGSATCGATLACMQSSKPFDQDQGASFFGCVVDSCPDNATQVSEALRCQFSAGHGKCTAECSGMAQNCSSCIQNACAAELGACLSAKCGG